MFSILSQLTIGLAGFARLGNTWLFSGPSQELQFYGALAALFIGLNLFLAIKYWRAYSLFLRIAAAVIVSLALLVALFMFAGFIGLVVWAGTLIVILTLSVQLVRARRQVTLDVLTLAIEKQMPLPPVLKALAADQWFSGQLLRLAENLERGMRLGFALKTEDGLLGREAVVAAQMGEATGNLAAAFRQAAAEDALRAPLRQSLLGHTFYLTSLAFFVPVILGFVTVFIVPKFISIFDDFGIELPDLTVRGVQFAYAFGWIGILMPLAGAAALLYIILCYADVWPLPGLGQGPRFERGRLLRTLALATESRRPLGETLTALAQSYPRRRTARQLQACANETRAGANWNISLLKHGLIGVQDAALIEAAQRLGNLPWALREAADGSDRRVIYRMEALLNVVSPIVILAWGALILFFAVACFWPIVELIFALSG